MDIRKGQKIKDAAVLLLIILITVLAGVQIPKLHIDSSIEVFIPEKNNVKKLNDAIQEEFGSMDSLLLGMEVRFGTVIEPENIVIIDEITEKLEDMPGVKEVISLTNMEYITANQEGMEVLPLLESTSPESISIFKSRLSEWQEMYSGTVISEDMKLAAMIIQPETATTEDERSEIYRLMEELTEEYSDENISFPMAGKPVIKEEISRSVFKDLLYLIPIAAALILLVLFISFRRLEGVLFPLLTLAAACIWVMGLMGFMEITFTMASLLVPVLLLVVGSAYGIHVMTHFYDDLAGETGIITFTRLNEILKNGIKKIRMSVILAGVTTAGGFISQLSSPLSPFRIFGIMSAAGIFFALLLTFLLIPALLRIRYSKGINSQKFHRINDLEIRTRTPRLFVMFAGIVRGGRIPGMILSVSVLVITLLLIPGINIGTNLIEFFTPESRMVRDTETFNKKLNGTGMISLLIEAPERGAVLNPAFLGRLEKFENWLPEEEEHVTRVQTIVPGIKRMNKVMNYDRIPYGIIREEAGFIDFFADDLFSGTNEIGGNLQDQGELFPSSGFDSAPSLTYEDTAGLFKNAIEQAGLSPSARDLITSFLAQENYEGSAFDEIPMDPAKYGFESNEELKELLSQYMILYSGNLSMMLNDSLEPDKILVSIQIDKESSREMEKIISSIQSYWNYYRYEDWSYRIGGNSTFNVVISDLVARSQFISLSTALVIVWLILVFLFKSVKIGTIGMIPVFFAIAGIFMFMVILNFNLDIVTALLAALAVGIGVDYSIHFINAYRRESNMGRDNVLEAVYQTTGKAILLNASSVALGFMGLVFSRFIPIRQLGILFAVSMIFACMATLIILPMILTRIKDPFVNDRKEKKPKEKEEWEKTCTSA